MRQLLLLRHAKSSWDDPKLPDHARPLNARGRRSATAMRGKMADLGLSPEVILVSSARRTLQTLEALEARAPWDATPLIEPMDQLYLANPDQILQALHRVFDTVRSVMVIGHNPGMHELAVMLTDAQSAAIEAEAQRRLAEAFPTAALCEFAIAAPWSRLEAGGGRLIRFVVPRDLPGAAD